MTRSPARRPAAPHLLALALLLAAAGSALAAEAPATAPEPAAAARWHDRLEPALAEAKASGHPILVDLYAEWCGWCHRLDAEVFSTPRFAEFAEDYVLLRVDIEDGGPGTWLRERLGVIHLPTMAILDADLVRLGFVEGYQPTEQFLLKIERAQVAYAAMLARDEKRMASGEREVLKAVGRELLARQDGARAARVYDKILADPKLPPAERAEMLLWRADAERFARRYEEAAATLAEARTVLADQPGASRLHDALDLGVLRLAHDRGGCPGVETLEAFVRDRAESRHVQRARVEIAELKAGPAKSCS
ncbi:MAG TPA: thioredoxin family protein [Thermoanaerobaculia bacterium]|nr:thioredoxin family protein [Thermoanaerobaculia bacterium]